MSEDAVDAESSSVVSSSKVLQYSECSELEYRMTINFISDIMKNLRVTQALKAAEIHVLGKPVGYLDLKDKPHLIFPKLIEQYENVTTLPQFMLTRFPLLQDFKIANKDYRKYNARNNDLRNFKNICFVCKHNQPEPHETFKKSEFRRHIEEAHLVICIKWHCIQCNRLFTSVNELFMHHHSSRKSCCSDPQLFLLKNLEEIKRAEAELLAMKIDVGNANRHRLKNKLYLGNIDEKSLTSTSLPQWSSSSSSPTSSSFNSSPSSSLLLSTSPTTSKRPVDLAASSKCMKRWTNSTNNGSPKSVQKYCGLSRGKHIDFCSDSSIKEEYFRQIHSDDHDQESSAEPQESQAFEQSVSNAVSKDVFFGNEFLSEESTNMIMDHPDTDHNTELELAERNEVDIEIGYNFSVSASDPVNFPYTFDIQDPYGMYCYQETGKPAVSPILRNCEEYIPPRRLRERRKTNAPDLTSVTQVFTDTLNNSDAAESKSSKKRKQTEISRTQGTQKTKRGKQPKAVQLNCTYIEAAKSDSNDFPNQLIINSNIAPTSASPRYTYYHEIYSDNSNEYYKQQDHRNNLNSTYYSPKVCSNSNNNECYDVINNLKVLAEAEVESGQKYQYHREQFPITIQE